MSWHVIAHPDVGKTVVEDPALEYYKRRGWQVLATADDKDELDPGQYALAAPKTGKEK